MEYFITRKMVKNDWLRLMEGRTDCNKVTVQGNGGIVIYRSGNTEIFRFGLREI